MKSKCTKCIYFSHFSFAIIVASIYTTFCMMDPDPSEMKKFNVISEYAEAALFYPEIRRTKLRLHNEPDLDTKSRIQICRDIIGSDFFTMWAYHSYEKATHPIMRLVPGSDKDDDINPIKKVNISIYGTSDTFPEYGFLCPAQKRWWDTTVEFFISEEYNINYDEESESHEEENSIAARFVFRPADEKTYLYLIAEEPAKTETSISEEVELHYLNLRKKYIPAPTIAKDDQLCRLDKYEKIRVCLSAFNSAHFNQQGEFARTEFTGGCEKRTVSFRTKEGKDMSTKSGHIYEEWTMQCKNNKDPKNNFLLSRAYKRNEIFVYFWDEHVDDKLYLEARMSKIRIDI